MADEKLPNAREAASNQLRGAPQPSKTDEIIDGWFSESFVNSRLGSDTETWNLVHAAKENLKQRLAKA